LTLSDQYFALQQSLSEDADLAKVMVKDNSDLPLRISGFR
jgi:hypothetical protein